MQFVVEKNGDVTNPKVVRSLEASLDSVAMNLIKGMPRWTPASDHGVKVRCKYSVPIAFKIPVPKPIVTPSPIKEVTLADSIKSVNDSTIIVQDSLMTDMNDSIIMRNDTIANDTTSIQNNLDKENIAKENTTKVKKRNAFVRFFRWLFGIKDKDENKESSKETKAEVTTDENAVVTTKEETTKEAETPDTTDKENNKKENATITEKEEEI